MKFMILRRLWNFEANGVFGRCRRIGKDKIDKPNALLDVAVRKAK